MYKYSFHVCSIKLLVFWVKGNVSILSCNALRVMHSKLTSLVLLHSLFHLLFIFVFFRISGETVAGWT
jgi:hypothetical protein